VPGSGGRLRGAILSLPIPDDALPMRSGLELPPIQAVMGKRGKFGVATLWRDTLARQVGKVRIFGSLGESQAPRFLRSFFLFFVVVFFFF
jgi:hypothetical protein